MGHITVNPLLSPPGAYFFQALLRGGLFNTNTWYATKDHFASAGPRSS